MMLCYAMLCYAILSSFFSLLSSLFFLLFALLCFVLFCFSWYVQEMTEKKENREQKAIRCTVQLV
jgi:hypothetical protein